MPAIHKAILRRLYDEAINQGNFDVIDQIVAPTFVDHHPPAPGLPSGSAGVKAAFTSFRAAFPDLHLEVEDMVTEFDFVFARYTLTGTHQGEFLGIPATGKRITISGTDMIRFAQSKVVERWGTQDMLGLLQQLGLAATPA